MADRASFDLNYDGKARSRVIFAPLEQIGEMLQQELQDVSRVVLCSDHAVYAQHGAATAAALARSGIRVDSVQIPGGEEGKSLDTVREVYARFVASGAERRDIVLALGGGVVGDLYGFVAATFLRGMRLVQVPTTVVAQVDSSIGGKVGVDLPEGKNLVGAFKHPDLVLIDNQLLHSLPDAEWVAGTAEVVKHGVIADRALFQSLEAHADKWRRRSMPTADLLAAAIAVKARIVQLDEREQGLRMTLNYGHTFGHALEAAAGYRGLRHGEAVGWGMAMEARLALALGLTTPTFVRRQDRLLIALGLLDPLPSLAYDLVISALFRDKKVVQRQLRWVLPLAEPGSVRIEQGVPLDLVQSVLQTTLAGRLLSELVG